MTDGARAGAYVVTSELTVPTGGEAALETAFGNRLRAVDTYPGFIALEVWRDSRAEGRYLLVSWWRSDADYRAYMHSKEHRDSHARVPAGPYRPAPVAVRRYEVVTQ